MERPTQQEMERPTQQEMERPTQQEMDVRFRTWNVRSI
jgi:hypothetical protein